MKAISRVLALLLFALPAWGACRSANSGSSYLLSNTLTTWQDASLTTGTVGWSQNANEATSPSESYFYLDGAPGETEAANAAFIIQQNTGKKGLHEYGAGTNQFTAADDFCIANSCSVSPPSYYMMVAEKIAATKTYNVDWVSSWKRSTEGNADWNETFSQTYTNEHTGGTAGLTIILAFPQNANWANFWFYRGTALPETIQRATVLGFYPWDSNNFFFIPCTNWDRPGMYGAAKFTYTVNNGPFQQPGSQPPATTLVMWNLQ